MTKRQGAQPVTADDSFWEDEGSKTYTSAWPVRFM